MPTDNKIDSEINDLANKMTKSTQDPKQTLINTILELGPEGLKKASQTLSLKDLELLKATLADMKKAATEPKPSDDAAKLTARKDETKHSKMRQESESGSDDADEKLMESSNAEHKAQGGPKDSPIEGQIIKGREYGHEHKTESGAIIIGHTASGKPYYANASHPAHVDMDHREHREAAEMHKSLAEGIRKSMDCLEKDVDGKCKDPEKHMELYSQARNHENNAMDHMKMSAKKEDAEMKKCYGSGMVKCMKKAAKLVSKSGGDMRKAYENFMTKAAQKAKMKLMKKQGVPEGVDPEKWERGVKEVKERGHDKTSAIKIINSSMKKGNEMEQREDAKIDDMKTAPEEKKEVPNEEKMVKKMKKSKKVEKSIRKIVKMAKSLKMSKAELVKAIKDSGNNIKLVKAELAVKLAKSEAMNSFTPNPEQDQVKQASQDKKEPGDKEEKIDTEKGELEIKAPKTADQAVNEVGSMSKSIQWDFKNSIGANTLGRNTHYEVDAYIEKSEAQKKEVFAKGGYWNDPQAVSLKKSEGEKADLNDLIEKGYTQSAQQIKRIQDLQNHKPDGIVLKKSFSDRELAAALGMDEKAYRAFMGSED